jgi:hypothetical protein
MAALAALVGLAFTAAPAQAQPCGNLYSDCEIAEEVYSHYQEWFCDPMDDLDLDDKTCEKMAEGFYKECVEAVKSSLKCWEGLWDSIPKTAKPACKQTENPSRCNASFKEGARFEKDDLQSDADDQLLCCEDYAEDFFDDCTDGCV